MPSVPLPDDGHCRYDLPSNEAATDTLVSGDELADPSEKNVAALELMRHLGVSYKAA
ncbi:hypothetical protein NTGBS_510029 [Candidatus Nitrotoga sp. BS]|nr:hypothetical protein NTGBS_510029 [Candidatus Nitrotoga sp. BS]